MLELIDTDPDINVRDQEYKRLLGFPPGYDFTERSLELATWAKEWYEANGRPWIYARETRDVQIADGQVTVNGTTLSSQDLSRRLLEGRADDAVLVAVSAGKECEEKARQLWNEEKPDEYFFLEIYGSAVVEHLIARAAFRLCEWADQNRKAVLPHYSPGYPGWEITDQGRLLGLLRGGSSNGTLDALQVLDSGMLSPKKSLLALFGTTSHIESVSRLTDLIPCENCSLSPCQYRRAPYRRNLPQLENVRQLGPGATASNHAYSFGTAALKKWSSERLRIEILDDKSVAARFVYEGTTCSNMGHPLTFEYHVKLSEAEGGYRIEDMRCAPAGDDVGHRFMCQYIENGNQLMKNIESEKPLLGRNLDEVFRWKRSYGPAGCYCDSVSREHKWGLVLEVLHYALVSKNGR